ncbi:hypothetical protein BGZ63DRAFT_465801 [Mariannaea sp. PMI_226]|nr:hypothetical protein BGZ63DRAFT_465801 [Mariannaea sp. PMI_226]
MASDEQQSRRGTRRRRRFLSVLAYASCSLHLVAVACIILLAVAGTAYTSWGSQGPASFAHAGEETLLYREFALVQFTSNISGSTPTLYWFLDAFGWEYFYGSDASAGQAYSGAGHTLHFPDSMNEFLSAYNATVGFTMWENCTFDTNVTQDGRSQMTCDFNYDNKTIAGFGAAPSLSVPTAPAFAFYMLVLGLVAVRLLIELIRFFRASGPSRIDEGTLLAVHALVPGAHLIAAACVTSAAARTASYLRDTPELTGLAWGVSLGSRFLELVWLGFLATVLGSIARVSLWWLKR